MAEQNTAIAKRGRRRRRRRKAIVLGIVAVLLIGGAGTAWAMRGSSGPGYRFASVARADVRQTVDSDGTLAARKTAALSFAASGTVDAIPVAVGDRVSAGQTVARIDPTDLQAAVTSVETTVAQAKQKLADDEAAQTPSTTTATTSSWVQQRGPTTTAVLLSARTSTPDPTPSSAAVAAVRKAQAALVAAQHTLDDASAAQDSAVKNLVTQCAATDDSTPTTSTVTASSSGDVSGAAGAEPVVITLRDADNAVATSTSANPQRAAGGTTYHFAGLTNGAIYTLSIVRTAVINTEACTTAVTAVSNAQHTVDTALGAVDKALTALTTAVNGLSTGSGGGAPTSGAPTSTPTSAPSSRPTGGASGHSGSTHIRSAAPSGNAQTGSARSGAGQSGTSGNGSNGTGSTRGTGSGTGSGSGGNATGSTAVITSEQIAADAKSIDAAQADLAVAQHAVSYATLTTPISGTVAAVGLTKGNTVSAGSSTSTVTVVGDGTLTVDLSIALADIDEVKVGESAAVTVDGRTTPLAAKVSYVGATNSASSTGSSSAYTVTVQLNERSSTLYDGMGASVGIAVGAANNVLTLPISAVHTTGTRHTVDVYAGGKVTARQVVLGIVGPDLAQIKSGVSLGDRVVLADLGAAIPSSNTNNRRVGTGSSLTGLTGGGANVRGGFGPRAGR